MPSKRLAIAPRLASSRLRGSLVELMHRVEPIEAVAARRPVLRVGFVPLTDCAPIALAQRLGFFARHGLNVSLHREIGWAAIRDKIINGDLQAAHAVAGMPFAATLGLGSPACPCVTGLVLNLHGNAITLSAELWREGVRDGATLHDFIKRTRFTRMLTFGVVFPFASHNFLLRRWLAAAGIDPEHDVRIVVVPPPQMPNALKAGHIDGCCAGEPWNSIALQSRFGWCVAASAEHEALIAALLDAAEYCDDPANREQVIEVLARREFLDRAPAALRPGLSGEFDFGHGQTRTVRDFIVFHRDHANEPSADKAAWVVHQLRASGVVPDPSLLVPTLGPRVFRSDIFERAWKRRSPNPHQPAHEKPETELLVH